MFDMWLLHYRGIANLSYVAHAYVLVTYDIIILILCDIMWLLLKKRFIDILMIIMIILHMDDNILL